MNKTDLVKVIVAENSYNITQACAEEMVNSFVSNVIKEVAANNKVQLVGFGTFEQSHRNERKCRNPRTGEEMMVAACSVPKFRPGTAFKNAIK